ncbi:MAG: hypothetical protein SGI92_16255 [Bryobacteraceae bacterium]|nr:hypothetical protein [Bryobacteraceae bacterium]
MDKTKADEALSERPIAKKVIARMKRRGRGKAVDISSWADGGGTAEEMEKEITAQAEFAALPPAFAAYLYPQIQISLMSEQLTALKEMAPFADIISQAEELYLPSGPPMSPLTGSYFTCWALFDACAGPSNETIGSTVYEIGASFGMDAELLRLIQAMGESRMGLYIHRGRKGKLTVLEDVFTGAVCRAIVPSGDGGKKGQLWYARVLPPPLPGGEEHVVFTTPYIVLHPGLAEWRAYFQRAIGDTSAADGYGNHMKFGPTRQYWNDFIFEAYVDYRAEAIFLAGLPDVPESRPHSEISEANGWKMPESV